MRRHPSPPLLSAAAAASLLARLLRHVYAAAGGDIEAELIARGLAVRFVRGARPHDWCRP